MGNCKIFCKKNAVHPEERFAIPAKAGIYLSLALWLPFAEWIPAFAGMTNPL